MTDVQLSRLLQDATIAQRAGNIAEAQRKYRSMLLFHPEHPIALNSLGMIALGSNDVVNAEDLFVRASRADPTAPELHLNIAKVRRLNDDDVGEKASLDAALALDQRNFLALLRLAELHERREEHVPAIERWTAVSTLIALSDKAGPEIDSIAAHAAGYLAAQRTRLADAINTGLTDARAEVPVSSRHRFEACMDTVMGKRRIYSSEGSGLMYPFLPADEFFARTHFPWLDQFESHTDEIRDELVAFLASAEHAVKPYVALEPGTPENKWSALDHSLDWGAIHLWRHGVIDPDLAARFPRLIAALADVPLAKVAGRMPTIFFSFLKPHTHLPPHTGVSNTRTIIHLPLIVPEGCEFRVGGEIRSWTVGEAFAFDDTIEHEAWNRSGATRIVLILDVWNPYLSAAERLLLEKFFDIADRSANRMAAEISD